MFSFTTRLPWICTFWNDNVIRSSCLENKLFFFFFYLPNLSSRILAIPCSSEIRDRIRINFYHKDKQNFHFNNNIFLKKEKKQYFLTGTLQTYFYLSITKCNKYGLDEIWGWEGFGQAEVLGMYWMDVMTVLCRWPTT